MDLDLDMSLSREEFLRLLPGALGLEAVMEREGRFSGTEGAGTWTLRLEPLPERHLGRVVLPRHGVRIHLEGYTQGEAEAFLARFHRGFLRGGG